MWDTGGSAARLPMRLAEDIDVERWAFFSHSWHMTMVVGLETGHALETSAPMDVHPDDTAGRSMPSRTLVAETSK